MYGAYSSLSYPAYHCTPFKGACILIHIMVNCTPDKILENNYVLNRGLKKTGFIRQKVSKYPSLQKKHTRIAIKFVNPIYFLIRTYKQEQSEKVSCLANI